MSVKMQLNAYLAKLRSSLAATNHVFRRQTTYFAIILLIISVGIGFTIWKLADVISTEHQTTNLEKHSATADEENLNHAALNNETSADKKNLQSTNSATTDQTSDTASDSADSDAAVAVNSEPTEPGKITTITGKNGPQHHLHMGNGFFKNANNTELLFGAKTLQNTKLKNFIGYGDIALYDSTVSGTVTIYGDMQTNNVKVNDTIIYGSAQLHDTDVKNRLSIYGEAFLINSKVNGDSTMFGTIDTDNTVFRGDITAATSKFTLLDSQTKGITVQKFKDKNKKDKNDKQIIRILGKSVINGDITFEAGSGIIELGSQAKINGKVKGGMLKRDKKK